MESSPTTSEMDLWQMDERQHQHSRDTKRRRSKLWKPVNVHQTAKWKTRNSSVYSLFPAHRLLVFVFFLTRSLSRLETQDIKTQPQFNHYKGKISASQILEEKWSNVKEDRCINVSLQCLEERFHKDNLRHLSRFPDFFVFKRILSTDQRSS